MAVVYWNGNSPKAELAEAEGTEEFVKGFEEILDHCDKLIKIDHEYVQIKDFNWLFATSKNKKINWYRVLHHEFAWAEKPKMANGQPKTFLQQMEEETKGALERVLAKQAAEKAAKEITTK
jgi:hypothetical protein